MTYTRFIAMILTSTVTMFGLMYLNTFVWSHVQFSETRTYMAIYMGATMAVIMLLFMWGMYRNKASNYAILGVSVVVFAASLYLLRSQATVGDISWMRAMIPHHSIAILHGSSSLRRAAPALYVDGLLEEPGACSSSGVLPWNMPRICSTLGCSSLASVSASR